MTQPRQTGLQLAVPNSDRVLLFMSAGTALLTVLMTLGIEHRSLWSAFAALAGAFGGPAFLLLAVWEMCRYQFRWGTAIAALLSAVSGFIAWATIALLVTGQLR
jgi:hypothetical protein